MGNGRAHYPQYGVLPCLSGFFYLWGRLLRPLVRRGSLRRRPYGMRLETGGGGSGYPLTGALPAIGWAKIVRMSLNRFLFPGECAKIWGDVFRKG